MRDAKREAALRYWRSATDFYQERDHRTALEIADIAGYAQRAIEIYIDPAFAEKPTTQAIALLATNLTARWARNVCVILPDVRLHPQYQRGRHRYLGERIIAEMTAADPFGNFQLEESWRSQSASAQSPLRLLIGPFRQQYGVNSEDFVVYATDWTALGRRGGGFKLELAHHATIAASGLAASLGVADLFKRAIGHPAAHWLPNFSWCTWSHQMRHEIDLTSEAPAPPGHLDLGETLLAGMGAIGSSFLYLADLLPLRGSLTVLDRDAVETSNLNRSLMFTAEDAINGAKKTEVARRYLDHQEISIRMASGTWREHSTQMAEHPFDVWISLTNEDGAWAEVPFLLPPIVLQATTSSGWGMGAGRHIPRQEDCVLCRLPRPETQFRGPCAEGNIALDDARPLAQAALPFLSAGAASLLLAEYLKLGSDSLAALPNEVGVDLRYGLPAMMALSRMRFNDCRGCAAAQSKLWEKRGGRGRFSHYSFGNLEFGLMGNGHQIKDWAIDG
jgi:hypothetical protein